MIKPWLNWNRVFSVTRSTLTYQVLWIVDACSSGIAGVDNEVELMGASAWGTPAPSDPSISFTRFLIDALKAQNYKPISAARLTSWMIYQSPRVFSGAQPVLLPAKDEDEPSAVLHYVSPFPPEPRLSQPHRYARVMITVVVNTPSTIPNKQQWSNWLKTNIPPEIGTIDIAAKWQSFSVTVLIEMPYEIWISLVDRFAYNFVSYIRGSVDFGASSSEQLVPRPSGIENIPFGARGPAVGGHSAAGPSNVGSSGRGKEFRGGRGRAA